MKTIKQQLTKSLALLSLSLMALVLLLSGSPGAGFVAEGAELNSYIVQADSATEARAAVATVGGQVTHELGVIDAVGAVLNETQLARLEAADLRLYDSHDLEVAAKGGSGDSSSGDIPETYYPRLVGAENLHGGGILGDGVGIAFVDTGAFGDTFLKKDATGTQRINVYYDAIGDAIISGTAVEESGHGTHVSSVAVSSGISTSSGKYQGIAPNANLIVVEAFDGNGAGNYLDVIRGIDWVVQNQQTYNIRVLNLSFSAPPQSYYWEDPLNQAVMRAWQAGIVVVAAAGNAGPDPMTIGVPGNVPYVITVGAFSDNSTPDDQGDDFVTSFSSAGPTFEAFIKPEVVAPGGHITGIMDTSSNLAIAYPEHQLDARFFTMSGTSQATAVTSGIVALMLQADPSLTPDDVKCRLMSGSQLFMAGKGKNATLAYSVFQQGAGVVNASDAVYTTTTGCANIGLDINADLDGTQHFQGPADQAPNGNYFVTDDDGTVYSWDSTYSGGSTGDGYAWSSGTFWAGGFAWSDGTFWSGSFAWSGGTFWSGSFAWSGATMAVNQWVEQE
jgi:serine protease AprX